MTIDDEAADGNEDAPNGTAFNDCEGEGDASVGAASFTLVGAVSSRRSDVAEPSGMYTVQ